MTMHGAERRSWARRRRVLASTAFAVPRERQARSGTGTSWRTRSLGRPAGWLVVQRRAVRQTMWRRISSPRDSSSHMSWWGAANAQLDQVRGMRTSGTVRGGNRQASE